MSTERKYVGRGNYANPINLTAENSPQAAISAPLNIWKPFPGLEHLYQISNYGSVRELATGVPVKTRLIFGNKRVLSARRLIGTRKRQAAIDRAVAVAFIENPNGYSVVKLIDASGPATHATNLQWAERVVPVPKPRITKKAFVPEYQEPQPTVVPANLSYNGYLFDRLLSEGRISQAERFNVGVITCQDDSMLPQLPEGVRFIHTTVEPTRYQSLIGKVVAVIVKAERFAYYVGRVVQITPIYVRVSRDNNQWSDRIESRSVIHSIARVVSVLETAVN